MKAELAYFVEYDTLYGLDDFKWSPSSDMGISFRLKD